MSLSPRIESSHGSPRADDSTCYVEAVRNRFSIIVLPLISRGTQ